MSPSGGSRGSFGSDRHTGSDKVLSPLTSPRLPHPLRPQPGGLAADVGVPTTKEDWDRFIDIYSRGGLILNQFPSTELRPRSGSGSNSTPGTSNANPPLSSAALSQTVDPFTSTTASTNTAIPPPTNSTITALEAQVKGLGIGSSLDLPPPSPLDPTAPSVSPSPSSLLTPLENSTSSSSNTTQDAIHPDVSSSGAVNQDPDIPNISPDDINESSDEPRNNKDKSSKAPRAQRMFRDKEEGDPDQEEGGLTRENIRQLEMQGSKQSSGTHVRRNSKDTSKMKKEVSKDKEGKTRQHKRPGGPNRENSTPGAGFASQRAGSLRRNNSIGSNEGSLTREMDSSSELEDGEDPWISSSHRPKPPRPRRPRSRGSIATFSRAGSARGSTVHMVDEITTAADHLLLESATGTSHSGSAADVSFNPIDERSRMREFFEEHGYLPPPRQSPDAMRRRLRVLRRLGLGDREIRSKIDQPNDGLDRFTRLAVSFSGAKSALITIVGKERQYHLSRVNFPASQVDVRNAFCSHSIVSTGQECLVVPDAAQDWRFRKNPLVDEGRGPIQFYAGAPLTIGKGPKATIIGSLCIIDDRPRSFTDDQRALLRDLASCVVSELELVYTQQAAIDSAKLHQISVDFLRRSLKSRPNERAGVSRMSNTQTQSSNASNNPTQDPTGGSGSGKRKSGADHNMSDDDIDIYDEACAEIRHALDAYAVAVVDLSQFHLFYPAFQGSSTAGTSTRGGTSTTKTQSLSSRTPTVRGGSNSVGSQVTNSATSAVGGLEAEAYAKEPGTRRARKTYALTDPTAPSRTPQVLFIPSGRRVDTSRSRLSKALRKGQKPGQADDEQDLAVLGYSCSQDNFAFNFTNSPQAKKVIADFIASNVKTRQVWYSRDNSEGIAQSITRLMPPGTETSLAMPIFGFDGQVAFAVVACWTDPLYTYPAGAMQFVETIAGSLLASVMKERLHQAERAQLSFAAAASHELRTPLHQINAAASLLRVSLQNALNSPAESPEAVGSVGVGDKKTSVSSESEPNSNSDLFSQIIRDSMTRRSISSEDRIDALSQLDIIETNGIALGNILENLIDTLDIGRLSKLEEKVLNAVTNPIAIPTDEQPGQAGQPGVAGSVPIVSKDKQTGLEFTELLENVVMDAVSLETKSRRVSGAKGMEEIEVILEVLPRHRGGWRLAQDPGPLTRALSKIIHNSCKFTDKGYIHVTVQDVSRDIVLPAGYDNSVKTSIIAIDIKDSGRGMSPEFLEKEVLRPFAKADAFAPGSGLGLGLAQRMIELLGGKLAIASTLGKGTLVHVELPIHLLNTDNDSDQDEIAARNENGTSSNEGEDRPNLQLVRQDGIYLAGFDSRDPEIRRADPGLARVGKSLLRQLKLNFCRVVPDIHYASLIVVPDTLDRVKLLDLAERARPNVEVIIIGKRKVDSHLRLHGQGLDHRTPTPELWDDLPDHLRDLRVQKLSRPLRPTLMEIIMKPPAVVPPQPETYVSPVVGGVGAEHSPVDASIRFGHLDQMKGYMDEGRAPPMSIPQVMSTDPIRGNQHPHPQHNLHGQQGYNQRPHLDRNTSHGTSTIHPQQQQPSNYPADSPSYENSSILPSPKSKATSPTSPNTITAESIPPLQHHRPHIGSTTLSDPFTSVRSTRDREDDNRHSWDRRPHAHAYVNDRERRGPTERRETHPSSGTGGSTTGSNMDGFIEQSSNSELGLPSTGSSSSNDHEDQAERDEHNDRHRNEGQEEDELVRPHPRLARSADVVAMQEDGEDSALRVLVVEDNAVNRKILITMLKRTACKYAEAVDGYEAISQFKTFRPDCVLLDINMPRKDGFQAASEMRSIERKENRKKSVIIAVTAMSSEAHRRKGLVECGIDIWKSKPVSIKELKEDVERLKSEGASGE